jgi:uncharacterized protein involved in exopolysaccharide biosynthesis
MITIPKKLQRLLWMLGSFVLGAVLGVFFHYVLYRLSLPIEPFIYVSF